MTKNELIKALQSIPGNPTVLIPHHTDSSVNYYVCELETSTGYLPEGGESEVPLLFLQTHFKKNVLFPSEEIKIKRKLLTKLIKKLKKERDFLEL